MNKKFALLLVLLASMVIGAGSAAAAQMKASGTWQVDAYWVNNADFLKGPGGEDKTFEVEQRMRTAFQFIANENLKAVLDTQIGTNNWGNGLYAIGAGRTPGAAQVGNNAGANTGNVGNIMLRKGYLDFKWPGTKVNFLVGYQSLSLPAALGGGSAILDDHLAAAAVVVPVNENLSFTGGYGRVFDAQTFGSGTTATFNGGGTSTDAAFLIADIKAGGFQVTPFAMYANGGHQTVTSTTGLTSLGGFTGPNASYSEGVRAYWGGVSFVMDVLNPFKVMADFNYGKATWNNKAAANAEGGRSGWMFDFAVDYTGLKFMTPEIFFAYSSGEDGNSTKGDGKSERMPIIANPQSWSPGGFFFGDRDFINGFGAQAGYVRNVLGFWTVGLSLKDITFIDKLKHTVNFIYIKGTNDKDSINADTGTAIGAYGAFLTEKDSLFEVDLNTKYMIYDQLSMYLNLGYIAADIDKEVWKKSSNANAAFYGSDGSKDAYRVGLGLTYAF